MLELISTTAILPPSKTRATVSLITFVSTLGKAHVATQILLTLVSSTTAVLAVASLPRPVIALAESLRSLVKPLNFKNTIVHTAFLLLLQIYLFVNVTHECKYVC